MSDHEYKAKWWGAIQRASRKGLTVEKSPLAASLNLSVESDTSEEELREKLEETLKNEPRTIYAYYKGLQLATCKSPFQKAFKRIVNELLPQAEKKTLKRQMKMKTLTQEAMSNEVIQAAIRIFKPTSVEVRPLRKSAPRRRRRRSLLGSLQGA